jgi:autotransporter-associated beta strand protein
MLWSDTNNWSLLATPTVVIGSVTNAVTFNNGGYTVTNIIGGVTNITVVGTVGTNVQGAVNNEVNATTTVNTISYLAGVSAYLGITNYDTTLLDPGVTLNIPIPSRSGAVFTIGEATDTVTNDDTAYYYKVIGPGAAIVSGDTNTPSPSVGLQITAVNPSLTNHNAVLDLSQVDDFTFGGGYFWVGINGSGSATSDRPVGQVYLAKTNLVVINGVNYDPNPSFVSFRVGDSRFRGPNRTSFVQLGQQNSLYISYLKIAGVSGALPVHGGQAGAYMSFETNLVNPTLKLRYTNGIARVPNVRIGDNSPYNSNNSIPSDGLMDLSGGTVDALVNSMYVGYGCTSGGGNFPNCWAAGALTYTAGTFDVTTLNIANQNGSIYCGCTGVVNVASSSATLIASNLYLGYCAGSAVPDVATLNINGGTVTVSNLLTGIYASSAFKPQSTVILTNGGTLNLLSPMLADFNDLEYGGTLNYSTNTTLTAKTINVWSPNTAFTVGPGLTLNPAGAGLAGTLNVGGALTLAGGGLNLDLGASLDTINVNGAVTLLNTSAVTVNLTGVLLPGTYPLITGTSLSGGLANLSTSVTGSAYPLYAQSRYTTSFGLGSSGVNFVVSGTPVPLTWSGGNNGNAWDLINTPNWNNGAQEFYQFDQVTFDDSGNAASPVQLAAALYPSSVTFNANANNYTLAGSGAIAGTASVTLNGGATVTLLNTNSYTGGTTINNGTLQIGDGTTANGTLTGNVTDNNADTTLDTGLVFSPAFANPATNQIQIIPATIAGPNAATIYVNGPGVTRLSGANSGYSGWAIVQQGTLQAGSATAFGPYSINSVVQVDAGATLDLNGNTTPNYVEAAGAGVGGNGAVMDSGAGCFMGAVVLTGDTTLGGVSGWTIQNNFAGGQGLVANGYNVTKVGVNQVGINQQLTASASAWSPGWASLNIQQGAFWLGGNINLTVNNPITIDSGATLVLRTLPAMDLKSAYTLNDGGCIAVPGVAGIVTTPMIDGSLTLGGTGVFDMFTITNTLTVNCPITGGTLVKGIGNHAAVGISTGAGALVLNNAVTTTGFVVQSGTVVLTNNPTAGTSASISAKNIQLAGGALSAVGIGGLTLNNDQSLTGFGTVVGAVSSPSGSSVAPAPTNGLITVNGSLTLAGTTTLDLNQTGVVATNSQLVVSNTLNCGGSLILTSSGAPPQAGATFKLFKAGTILNPFTDAAISYPALSAGLSWTNLIAVNGTLAVVSSQRPSLSVAVAGGGSTLSVSWPTNYSSYVLQAQTNSLSVGLSTNWTTINTTNNQINLPVNPANASVFLRLINPQ